MIIHSEEAKVALRKGCQFIREIGNRIGFPNRTVLTAQWYFRKFYQTRPLDSSFPSLDIALTAVILASKVEESFEKIKSILITAFLILNGKSFQGRPEDIKITEGHKLRVIQYERDLLISVEFQFNLAHPHALLVKLAHTAGVSKSTAAQAWELLDRWYCEEDFVLWSACEELALRALKETCEKTKSDEGIIQQFCKFNGIKLP